MFSEQAYGRHGTLLTYIGGTYYRYKKKTSGQAASTRSHTRTEMALLTTFFTRDRSSAFAF